MQRGFVWTPWTPPPTFLRAWRFFCYEEQGNFNWWKTFLYWWFAKGILSIKFLQQEIGQFLTYEEFQRKYSCKTDFLNFYQVLSTIPQYLLFKSRNPDDILKNAYLERSPLFQLLNGHELNLNKAKTNELRWILKWTESYITASWTKEMKRRSVTGLNEWRTFFKSARKRISKENFNFSFYIG